MSEHVSERLEPAVEPPRLIPEPAAEAQPAEPIFDVNGVAVFYGDHRAVTDITLKLRRNQITALIGPSGCGKSTFIRCLNRMNDLIPGARVGGPGRLPRRGPLRG